MTNQAEIAETSEERYARFCARFVEAGTAAVRAANLGRELEDEYIGMVEHWAHAGHTRRCVPDECTDLPIEVIVRHYAMTAWIGEMVVLRTMWGPDQEARTRIERIRHAMVRHARKQILDLRAMSDEQKGTVICAIESASDYLAEDGAFDDHTPGRRPALEIHADHVRVRLGDRVYVCEYV